ncbi:MAG: hypothetical protein J0M08_13170 [Bacteroidetes bacterium]|nr:hypothetical protein [Bacteroidota bacterium]
MILFTADIDWACEEVIADTISLFEKYNVKCTFFATHDSSVLKNCNKDLFEIGLHPNFNQILNGTSTKNAEQVFKELKEIYPFAKGARSHSLTQSGPILDIYKRNGMEYECNHFLPYHQGLKPFKLWNDLIRIPFNWEDDYHFALGYSFDDYLLDFNDAGLNILNFHPIHVFLNSEDNNRYLGVKNMLNNPTEIAKNINKSEVKGTRDILIKALEFVSKSKLNSFTLSELIFKHKQIAVNPSKTMFN